jgi:hypothetical protein
MTKSFFENPILHKLSHFNSPGACLIKATGTMKSVSGGFGFFSALSLKRHKRLNISGSPVFQKKQRMDCGEQNHPSTLISTI